MSYKNNRIFHYNESVFLGFFQKTHLFYLLCSYCFWITIVGFHWIKFFDSKFGDNQSLYQIHSFASIINIIIYFASLLGLCILTGTFLSIPAILCRSALNYIILKSREKYKKVVNLVLLAQYLPYILLIVVNVSFYQINISTSIYQDFFYNFKLKNLKSVYTAIGKKNTSGQYIFLVPSYLIDNPDKLKQTKSILPFQGAFLMETNAKSEMIAQIIHNESDNIVQYYSLVPMHKTIYNKNSEKQFLIGTDRQYSSELLELFSNNLADKSLLKVTKPTLLANRTMAALKPIQLVLKSNFLGFFNKNWRWDNFGNTSLDIFLQYAHKAQSVQYNIVLLSNPTNSKKTFLFGSLDFITPADRIKVEDIFDKNLSTVINALLDNNVKNIFILPYQSNNSQIQSSNFLTTTQSNAHLKSYRTILSENKNEFICKSQFIENNSFLENYNKILMNKIQFGKGETIYLNPKYNLYIKEFFTNTLICYEHGEKIFLLKKHNDINNQNNYSPNIKIIDVYEFDNTKTMQILSEKEKIDFFDKYKYEIFKS